MKKYSNQLNTILKTCELDLSTISDRELIPPEIVVYLTGTCNYADCKHCIIKDNFSGSNLPLDVLKKIFIEMNELEIPFVSFTGGEPFDYEEGLENAIKLARENNIFINQIITNASFAKDGNNAITKLKEIKDAGFSAIEMDNKWIVPSLTISVDDEHQKFIPIQNVKNLISATKSVFGKHVDITINYVLFSETKEEVLNKNPWLKDVNVDFANVCYEGRAKDLKNKKLLKIKEHVDDWNTPCSWTSKKWPTVPAIFPNGQINFCCYFGLNKILSLGNIHNISIKESLRKINSERILIALFRYGPVELSRCLNYNFGENQTYGKCGLCNILLNSLD